MTASIRRRSTWSSRRAGPLPAVVSLTVALAGLAGCGGGGVDAGPTAAAATAPPVAAAAPPVVVQALPAAPQAPVQRTPDRAARLAAADATAASGVNDCAAIRPFYWELGDRNARLAGGPVASTADGATVQADTVLQLASATKWLYAAYVLERRGGEPTPEDLRMLTQRSGYVSFQGCRAGQSVDACLDWQSNGSFTPAADGRFFYNGGHFQRHASRLGLGALHADELAAEWRAWLGTDLDFGMTHAQPGGGATGSATMYARFLRKLLGGELALARWLDRSSVCAQPTGCPSGEALYSPAPAGETWHYGLGHWVEDDPGLGDGSVSSAGAFGFYPWIDGSRSTYGVIARMAPKGGGQASARCGRLIRQAWQSGVAH